MCYISTRPCPLCGSKIFLYSCQNAVLAGHSAVKIAAETWGGQAVIDYCKFACGAVLRLRDMVYDEPWRLEESEEEEVDWEKWESSVKAVWGVAVTS